MSGFFQSLLTGATGPNGSSGIYLRDYIHAAKTFRTNGYQNAPKFKYLFHTYFEINPESFQYFYGGRPSSEPSINSNYGLLVKEIKLPSFSFNQTELNQYNRKRIIQTKIKYDPIEVIFHDDNGDVMNGMWQAYYNYYYNDGNNPGQVLLGAQGGPYTSGTQDYNDRNIYDSDLGGQPDWGFSGGQSDGSGRKVPFFNNITVFGFNQHNFTAYTLVNPLITNFSHDTYNYSEGTGTMANRMTIAYETVVYNYGNMDGRAPSDIVTGFGNSATYDTRLSPIAHLESNGTALGQGGLINSFGGSITSGTSSRVLRAVGAASAVYNGITNPNLAVSVGGTLDSLLTTALQTAPINRNSPFFIPTAGSSPGPGGLAGSLPINALLAPPTIDSDGGNDFSNAGEQYSGEPSISPFNDV